MTELWKLPPLEREVRIARAIRGLSPSEARRVETLLRTGAYELSREKAA